MRLSNLVPNIFCPNGLSCPTERLPNTLNLGFKGVRSDKLLSAIELSVSASVGSACYEAGGAMSTVFGTMGVPTDYAIG